MDKYQVRLNERAYKDLDKIFAYISYDKLSPINAKKQVERIKNAIFELEVLPQSHQERQVGRFANKGYRQHLIDNYVIIYKIDEKDKIVRIVTIQYQGRNI